MSRVVVAIIGYRSAEEIAACIATLKRSSHDEVCVRICENGGAESFAALVDGFADDPTLEPSAEPQPSSRPAGSRIAETRVFRRRDEDSVVHEVVVHRASDNLGYAGAINEILNAIRDRTDWSWFWILNPDTEPSPDALERLLRHACSGGYGIVGARLILKDSETIQLYGGRWRALLGRGFNIGWGAAPDAPVDVAAIEREQHYVAGASMFVSRAFIERVGPMHEDYFLYAEEIDWCLRRGTFRLGYAHDAVVLHAHGATIGSSLDRREKSPISVYLDERARHLLTKRFYPRLYPLVLITTLAFTAQYARAGALRNFGFALLGWWAGVCGQTGYPHRMQPLFKRALRSAS